MRTIKIVSALAFALVVGCGSTKPKSAEGRADLETHAIDTISEMGARVPGLSESLSVAEGYAVFPEIGEGGLIIGGAHGHGVLYQGGAVVGYVKLNEASIGLQAGAESFSELIVFYDLESLENVKRDKFELGADASVTMIHKGAAAAARPAEHGTAVYIMTRGGLMADVSVSGQRIDFEPRG